MSKSEKYNWKKICRECQKINDNSRNANLAEIIIHQLFRLHDLRYLSMFNLRKEKAPKGERERRNVRVSAGITTDPWPGSDIYNLNGGGAVEQIHSRQVL